MVPLKHFKFFQFLFYLNFEYIVYQQTNTGMAQSLIVPLPCRPKTLRPQHLMLPTAHNGIVRGKLKIDGIGASFLI